jgi:chromosome segregation ATPase
VPAAVVAPPAGATGKEAIITPSDSGVGTRALTLQQAIADLQSALDNPETTEAQLKQKLAVVRDSRQKTKADLQAARKELLLILTADQEATLVAMGYLD